jgi:hypothetical protein
MNGAGAVSSSNITFYDNFVPALQAGQYTVTVSQSLTAQGGEPVPSTPQEGGASQSFIVRGPRFVLDPADVHRVFPPKNGTGVYDAYLPMVVLNKRALPWERALHPSQPPPMPCPWLALLLFRAEELLTPQPPSGSTTPPPSGSLKNPTRSASFALNNVVNATFNGAPTVGPPAGTLGPTLLLEADEDPTTIFCNVIDIAAETFAALMPTLSDLPYLSHVRQVSTENKVPMQMKHDGWFSAVIGNRFAIPPSPGGSREANIAHLVSLEGLETYIGLNAPVTPSGFQKVRLISLCSWSFTCLRDPQEDFRQLMLELIKPDENHVPPDLLLRLPVASNIPEPEPGAEATALARLDAGYVPLSYATRSGEATFCWYRGPLTPTPVATFMQTNPESAADNPMAPRNVAQAMIYEPVTGLFDQSYAVAFQTGRSLALASLPFSTSLLQWRRAAHHVVDVLLEMIRSPNLSGILQQDGLVDGSGNLTGAGVSDLAALLDANIVSNAFQDFLATEFADNIASQIGKAGGFTPQDQNLQPQDPPTPAPQVPADLANLMQDPTVVQLLEQLSGFQVSNDQAFEPGLLPDIVVQWLAKLALLYGVPFNNLVPSAAMLPVDSIRFFYVDMNWIDSLLDGAASVGMQSTRDSLFHQLMRDPLRRAVDDVIGQVRDIMRGVTPGTAPPPTAMAGFVLRSAGVAGWPGLETRAWCATPQGNEPMKPLRLDRVAPSVLIGIFPDLPIRLEFNEPSEGLVFGLEDQGLTLRYLPGAQGATAQNIGQVIDLQNWITPSDVMGTRRALPILQPPLDVANKLVPLLLGNFAGQQPSTLSPASFAIQMVRVPEQMLFLAPDGGLR